MSTVDFFPPVVDDAHTWGRIAAANAAGDVYAMGGRPLFALNLVVWPRALLPLELLSEVLRGGARTAEEGGWSIAGGHTSEGPEPMYGQAVTGDVDPDLMFTNAGALAGQLLVLTKPLGTGIVTTAHKRLPAHTGETTPPVPVADENDLLVDALQVAVEEMCRLNDTASALATEAGVRGATDVTGFGLLGHLHEMCAASGVGAHLDTAAVPLLPNVVALAAAGHVPGGTGRNLAAVRAHLAGADAATDDDAPTATSLLLNILADPQTSGGLLLACPPETADDLLEALAAAGHTAGIIGETAPTIPPGVIELAPRN